MVSGIWAFHRLPSSLNAKLSITRFYGRLVLAATRRRRWNPRAPNNRLLMLNVIFIFGTARFVPSIPKFLLPLHIFISTVRLSGTWAGFVLGYLGLRLLLLLPCPGEASINLVVTFLCLLSCSVCVTWGLILQELEIFLIDRRLAWSRNLRILLAVVMRVLLRWVIVWVKSWCWWRCCVAFARLLLL